MIETMKWAVLCLVIGGWLGWGFGRWTQDARPAADPRLERLEERMREVETYSAFTVGRAACVQRPSQEDRLFMFDPDDNKLERLKDFK